MSEKVSGSFFAAKKEPDTFSDSRIENGKSQHAHLHF